MKLEERMPPYDLESEKQVCGALLIDGEVIHDIRYLVNFEDFFTEQNRIVYKACVDLANNGTAIDQVTVAHELKNSKQLVKIGGIAYLSHLVAECPTSVHGEYYAQIVKRCAIRRKAITMGSEIMELGYNEDDPNKVVSESEKRIIELQKEVALPKLITPTDLAKKGMTRYGELRDGKRTGIYTGFIELDRGIGGLYGGELCYLAARPGMGKTELLLSMAKYVGKHYGKVLLASLEMPWGDILDRLVSQELEVSPRIIRGGCYSDDTMDKISNYMATVSDSGLFLYDSGGNIDGTGNTTESIYSMAYHMKLAYGLPAIFIDYLGLIADSLKEKSYERISLISGKLKRLARDLDVPVICACQLNREVEHRMPHIPQLSDMRDSGAIEQDADTVLFLYRPEKYDDEMEEAHKNGLDLRGKATLVVGKQRQGGEATDRTVGLIWDKDKRKYRGEQEGNILEMPEQFR